MTKALAPESGNAQWGATMVLALSMLLASLGTSIANIALPALTKDFSAPFIFVQGVVVAYLAAMTVSTLVAGQLGDTYGLRRIYLVGLGAFTLASLLCGIAPNLWLLITFRVFQGVGAAFLMTLSMALMRESAGKERMGRAMGLLGAVSALGTALGPSVGGALIPVTGWRGVFLVLVPLALLALGVAHATLPRSTGRNAAPTETIWTMLDVRILPNLIVNVLVGAVMMTTLVVGPFYLGSGVGLPEAVVGLVMSVGPVVSIICGVPAGRGVDSWGVRRTLAFGLAMLTVGAVLLSVLPVMIGVTGYVLAIVVLTPGYQLFQAANNTAALADVPRDRRGIVSGLLTLSRNVGLIAGATVMGAVFVLGAGTDDIAHAAPTAIADGIRLTFMLAAGMMILAILVTFRNWGGKALQGGRQAKQLKE